MAPHSRERFSDRDLHPRERIEIEVQGVDEWKRQSSGLFAAPVGERRSLRLGSVRFVTPSSARMRNTLAACGNRFWNETTIAAASAAPPAATSARSLCITGCRA